MRPARQGQKPSRRSALFRGLRRDSPASLGPGLVPGAWLMTGSSVTIANVVVRDAPPSGQVLKRGPTLPGGREPGLPRPRRVATRRPGAPVRAAPRQQASRAPSGPRPRRRCVFDRCSSEQRVVIAAWRTALSFCPRSCVAEARYRDAQIMTPGQPGRAAPLWRAVEPASPEEPWLRKN